jgi:transcriptional regulator with XRE-family HTH domain
MPKKQRANSATIRFGQVIQRLRIERGWTLVKFAQRTGMNPTYLGVLEKGGNMPSVETLFELADVFNVKAWQLLREFEEPEQPAKSGAE